MVGREVGGCCKSAREIHLEPNDGSEPMDKGTVHEAGVVTSRKVLDLELTGQRDKLAFECESTKVSDRVTGWSMSCV